MLMTFNQFLFDKKTILFYSDINLKLKWNMPTLPIRALEGGGRSGSLFIRYCLDDGRFCMLMTFNQFLFDKKNYFVL